MAEINDHEFMPIVPFMPANPQYGNAYVPYQMDFDIVEPKEAMEMEQFFRLYLANTRKVSHYDRTL